jgi:alanyl-tRNA synthetase
MAGGIKVLAQRADGLGSAETRTLADNLRQKLGSGIVILGRAEGEKATLLVAVTDDLKGRLPAGDLVRELAKIIGGGGGGRPDLAEAGGKDPSRLDEALRAGVAAVARRAGAEAP